jgi:hypothetical protein
MIIEITQSQFHKWLNESDSYQKWSDESLEILWDYYTELEIDSDKPMRFDFVAIRSEWHEYETLEEIKDDYRLSAENDLRERLNDEEFLEWLGDETTFFKLPNGAYLVKIDF